MSRRSRLIDRRASAKLPRPLRALLALAAALALLASQAVSALHFAFVPHHLCGIHGALEDGAVGVSVAHHSGDLKVATATAADATADAHEACVVAALRKHAAAVPPTVALAVTVGAEISSVECRGVDVKPGRASLLARAPKLSPPRLG